MSDDPVVITQRLALVERELASLRTVVADDAPAGRPDLELPLLTLLTRIGPFRLALPVHAVVEVTPMVLVSPLPGAQPAIRGVIDFRGQLLPVLDLAATLQAGRGSLGPELGLVVVDAGPRRLALVIDAEEGVRTLDATERESDPPSSNLPRFVLAVFRVDAGPVFLVDPDALLAAGESRHHQDLLNALGPGAPP